jgi:sulfatase maturation enzyme AslB (radical SAM superfamily)
VRVVSRGRNARTRAQESQVSVIEARPISSSEGQPAYSRAAEAEVLDPMSATETQAEAACSTPSPAFPWKLWIYTNYDCNLRCRYCVAKSSPNAPRRAIGLANVKRLVDESIQLGFVHAFFTGGEPFLLPDIYDMLAYSSARLQTTVLTNAMLLHGTRLEKLVAIANDQLIVQVSLDGGRAEDHDAYRGGGSWARTVEGICRLQARGFRVRLGTTETPANSNHMTELCEFHRSLGIPDEDHFVRPLARRGNSREGLELSMANLVPEVTVNLDGVFWHPLSTDGDMQVSKKMFPLAPAVDRIQHQLEIMARTGNVPLIEFK